MNEERHGFFDNEMQMLESIVGKEVKCVYISRGEKELKGYKGTLSNLNAYDSIRVGSEAFSFLGDVNTIVCIGDSNDNLIYKNNRIPLASFLENYPKYFLEIIRLMQDQQEYLGYSVKQEEMQKGR